MVFPRLSMKFLATMLQQDEEMLQLVHQVHNEDIAAKRKHSEWRKSWIAKRDDQTQENTTFKWLKDIEQVRETC